MTTERDPRTRIVLSWLREEVHENAERVLLRTLDEVDTTPQRRSRWPAWRTDRMDTYAKLIAAAAATLVVAIGGYQSLPGGSGSGGTRAAPPSGLAGNGVIALVKDGDIVVADRPGGETRPLIAGPELDDDPIFSPDGTKLAFVRSIDARLGRGGLMVADADGTNVVQITQTLDPLRFSFAPDGRSLIAIARIYGDYESAGPEATSEIGPVPKRLVVIPVDPAAAPTVLDIRLPDTSMDIELGGGPSFRPANPQEILVVGQSYPDGPRGIYVYDLATGGIRTIVEPAAFTPAAPNYVVDIAWSPTGEHISYGLNSRSRVVAADGTGDRTLDDTPGTAADGAVSPWSNDGTRMVIVRRREGTDDLQTVVVNTSGDAAPVELACGPTDDECLGPWIWSPDDSMLIGRGAPHETSAGGSGWTYQLADPATGQVTELDWDGYDKPTWQRVAP